MVAAKIISKNTTEGTMLRQEHSAEKWVATLCFEVRRWMERMKRMEWMKRVEWMKRMEWMEWMDD